MKPHSDFGKARLGAGGLQHSCKSCTAEYRAANSSRMRELDAVYRSRPEVKKSRWLERIQWKYGVSLEIFDNMVLSQMGLCAICDRQLRQPHIDHDHTTGVVRGLLCPYCNTAIGSLGEDPDTLMRAVDYLLIARADDISEAVR